LPRAYILVGDGGQLLEFRMQSQFPNLKSLVL